MVELPSHGLIKNAVLDGEKQYIEESKDEEEDEAEYFSTVGNTPREKVPHNQLIALWRMCF